MKHQILILLVALSAVFGITATSCRKEKTYKIGVSQCSSDDWRERMNEEILREAMFHDNVEVEILSADDSNEKQIEDIRYFADHGFDIIIVAPNEAEPITPVIDDLIEKGFPVLVFDRNVVHDNYTAFQGAHNDSIGYQAARYTASIAGPAAKVIEITGNMGSTPARERQEGFMKGLEGMTVLASATGNWTYDEAYEAADSMLTLYPDADAVFAHNDRMAIAAADVAAKKGVSPKIIGIDAAPEIGMKAVADGKIDATFIYPTAGDRLLKTALNIVEGKPYDKVTLLPAVSAVDKSNADILILQNESVKDESAKVEYLKTQVDDYWNKHSMQTIFLYITVVILVLLFMFLFLFLRAYWQKKRQQELLLKQNAELEQQRDNEKMLNRQLNEATQSKLMFFTHVSHDLRTPLTLIAEPIHQLSEATNLTEQQMTLVKLADKNIHILRRLINQVLDFRKYENGFASLTLSEVDLRSLVTDWTDTFRAVARRHDIKLGLEISPDFPEHIAIDVEKIERVFFNLLSNAFKYTPDNGSITVILRSDGDKCLIAVKDTGRGIPAKDLPNVFENFFQVDKIRPNGSGIGLSLAKAFVELHEGTITVESKVNEGSVFTVTLPIRHVAERAEDLSSTISGEDVASELDSVDDLDFNIMAPSVEEGKEKLPIALVIDDNQDIRVLVSSILEDTYNVITARTGNEGMKLAAKFVPDLVICDVMMPGIDGLECCRRLKAEVSTSHIPVLMLTACSLDEQRVEGYESGADGYISKPFNAEVLKARCKNLIDNRLRIKNLVSAPEMKDSEEKADARIQQVDNSFYRKFLEVLNAHLSDPDYNVDAIASELGLGRSQFYRKIKSLTNYSPVELIRHIRLKEARSLLLKSEKTISEIAFETGFSTPAYFTKCFKDVFGATPSEFRANLTR